jgi:hypothetical protein
MILDCIIHWALQGVPGLIFGGPQNILAAWVPFFFKFLLEQNIVFVKFVAKL